MKLIFCRFIKMCFRSILFRSNALNKLEIYEMCSLSESIIVERPRKSIFFRLSPVARTFLVALDGRSLSHPYASRRHAKRKDSELMKFL